MIDPRTVMIASPSYSQSLPIETCGTLISCARMFGAISFTGGVSHPALARNIVAEKFLKSGMEWLLTFDDDMIFQPHDLQIMLQPMADSPATIEPEEPTRVEVPVPEAQLYNKVWQGRADALVCAEYSYKSDDLKPVHLGLGMTRIHRSVFERIRDQKHEDGQTRTWQFLHNGTLYTDFFPCGAVLAQIMPNAPWTGEDHGFFMLARLAGIVPRIETRTNLFHLGKKAYPYRGSGAEFSAQ